MDLLLKLAFLDCNFIVCWSVRNRPTDRTPLLIIRKRVLWYYRFISGCHSPQRLQSSAVVPYTSLLNNRCQHLESVSSYHQKQHLFFSYPWWYLCTCRQFCFYLSQGLRHVRISTSTLKQLRAIGCLCGPYNTENSAATHLSRNSIPLTLWSTDHSISRFNNAYFFGL